MAGLSVAKELKVEKGRRLSGTCIKDTGQSQRRVRSRVGGGDGWGGGKWWEGNGGNCTWTTKKKGKKMDKKK